MFERDAGGKGCYAYYHSLLTAIARIWILMCLYVIVDTGTYLVVRSMKRPVILCSKNLLLLDAQEINKCTLNLHAT